MAHVLLVEPNKVLARTYIRALEHGGHTVGHATGAQEAVDVADDHQPAVVVLELQLGARDGIEFLHEFRSYPEWQGVPVILHTQVTPVALAQFQRVLASDLGVVASLYKPQTSLVKLISTVNIQVAT
ncbi:MAG TPA: response regulator [Candidatus Saccharimonadales bacterium]|nr:response regulator [Candidatus Saccharimonadales bacterium]